MSECHDFENIAYAHQGGLFARIEKSCKVPHVFLLKVVVVFDRVGFPYSMPFSIVRMVVIREPTAQLKDGTSVFNLLRQIWQSLQRIVTWWPLPAQLLLATCFASSRSSSPTMGDLLLIQKMTYITDTDSLFLSGDLTSVPEPGTIIMLLGGGLLGLAFYRRKRSKM